MKYSNYVNNISVIMTKGLYFRELDGNPLVLCSRIYKIKENNVKYSVNKYPV